MKAYHVDAFAKNVFTGNPAVVCVLDHWPDDGLMRQIAIENNLSETAYTVPEGDDYRLRWFTPGGEIDLCGHATLATAFVLANFIEPERQVFHFHTLGGDLTVRREGELFSMDFPAYAMQPVAVTAAMTAAIGRRPLAAYMARDLVCIMDDEDFVRQAEPNQEKIRELDGLLLHITAKGRDYDCVSRSFAPKLKVPEDPVCGSGHCHILPIWAAREGKTALHAYQASQRGGELFCQVHGDRVTLSGYACLYSTAELHV